jgi:thiamine pyrophosphokinase
MIGGMFRQFRYFATRAMTKVHFNDFYKYIGQKEKMDLIVLNTHDLPPFFDEIWMNSQRRIAADGGANRLFKYNKELIPTHICGDFDSIKDDVREWYRKCNVTLWHDTDDSLNDLQKSLKKLYDLDPTPRKIVVVNATGGRFDQVMCNLNALYTPETSFDIVMLGTLSVTFLLKKGSHVIKRNPDFEREICGMIPLGCKVDSVTTKGLKYELSNLPLEFGKIVSTSNEFVGNEVFIETSHDLLWCSTLRKEN